MKWRVTQSESRKRYLANYDHDEVELYESWISQLTEDDNLAYLDDIEQSFTFHEGMQVLDVGAGTGAMCSVLTRKSGLILTALEPVPAMSEKLRAKPELRDVKIVAGFCDSEEDRSHFPPSSFDLIISRQLVNGLYDPLRAFHNWLYWLKSGGAVIVTDGLYDRSSWAGKWEQELDVLPMSACRTMAMTPYLLEVAGFRIEAVTYMTKTNARPATRTQRYLVVARKHA